MKVIVKGKGEVNLTKSNFVAKGGEGEVYIKGRTAYKIYLDSGKMISHGKMQELLEIKDPNIIRPQNIILNTKKKPIGYTMKAVSNTHTLCQIFTKTFKNRHNIDHDHIGELVKQFRNLIEHIHSKKILLVDINELNFLLNNKADTIYAIDTDSYQTPSFPATAIMDSVRDRHVKTFTEESDWFSFGILTFQMFIGIHPYKGKHKSVKSLDDRMKQNLSVFNKDVSVPKVCFPFDIIPDAYRDWYKAIFDDGKRVAPPTDFHAVTHMISTKVQHIKGSNNFDIEEIQVVKGDIIDVLYRAGIRCVLTNKKLYFQQRDFPINRGIYIGLTPSNDTPVLAKLDNGELKLFNVSKQSEIPLTIKTDSIFTSGDRIYLKTDESILEINFFETRANVIASTKNVANIYGNASKFFDGVVIQNLLGAIYISMFPEHGIHRQVRMKELDEHKIIDAKYESNVLMVVAFNKCGVYDRFIFRFAKDWGSYDIRIINNITPAGLNFTVLDSELCVHINENEDLEMFSNKKDSHQVQVITDPVLSGDMKLFKHGAKLMFAQDNKLYSMKKM